MPRQVVTTVRVVSGPAAVVEAAWRVCAAASHGSADERRLLPMLIGGLVLVVIGMIMVMIFV